MNHTVCKTLMAREIQEIPQVLARQAVDGLDLYFDAGRKAEAAKPIGFVTCARGSSDHAATFFKYVMEMRTGLPVASIGPSVASVYKTQLKLANFVCVAISQSGESPDLATLQKTASKGGACTIAILNETNSAVGRGADTVLPVLAGRECAVAASKSFVASLYAILGFAAGFCNDNLLKAALLDFPKTAGEALNCDWRQAQLPLARAGAMFTVGRGPGLAVSAEAALKLKETCRIHAEAFSAAEVLHGPVILADYKFATLLFEPQDRSQASVEAAAEVMRKRGASVFLISPAINSRPVLPVPAVGHELLLPLVQIIAFYKFVELFAQNLGENTDAPDGLKKVTVTL